ncbi:MAG: hypothetical protein KF886_23530 [Candidatus Hydrogenedentes bacterium]|nr:hypothetical protein [Candidatus Hydrogenedentota bacterium]
MEKNRPAHEIRIGAVKAVIWANQSESGVYYNVNLSRIYKDGDDWKSTDSFRRDDLPLVAKLADKAFDWILNPAGEEASD